MLIEGQRTVKELTEELNVNEARIIRWRKEYEKRMAMQHSSQGHN
jgi:transposase-like protein